MTRLPLVRARFARDLWLQALTVALAAAQIAAIVWSTSAQFAEDSTSRAPDSPPVVPALYTFAVWGVIYAGSLAYAVYQAWPAHREHALLRRVRPWAASAFLFTALWALAAGQGWGLFTVPLMFALFGSLLGAFIGFSRQHAPERAAERWLVAAPLSIFLGYVTLATVANTASVLKQAGILAPPSGAETGWAVFMLLVAGGIAALLTRWSRGNVPYALTVIWALVGVGVANVRDVPNLPAALAAGAATALVGLTLLATRALRLSGRTGPREMPG